MNLIRRIALGALAAAALVTAPAAAQGITSPIRYIEQGRAIGPFVGYLFANPDLAINDSVSVAIGPKSAPIFGVQFQTRVGGPMSVQAKVGYVPSKRDVFLAEAVNDSAEIRAIATDRQANVGIGIVEAGILFNLTGPRTYRGFAPYVGATVGYTRQISGKDPLETSVPESERYRFGPSFALALNAGSEVFLTRSLALRAEVDGRLWRLSAPAGFRRVRVTKISEWTNASSAQVGLALHF